MARDYIYKHSQRTRFRVFDRVPTQATLSVSLPMAIDSPTTPRKYHTASDSSIQTTTGSSRALTSTYAYEVKHVYENELKQRTETVPFHTFLLFLLSLVMETEDTAVERLSQVLKSLLSDAVAMCNADRTDAIKDKSIESALSLPDVGKREEKKTNRLQKLLLEFRKEADERNRCKPFCSLVNTILEMKQQKPDPSEACLRPPCDGNDRLVFQRNDPVPIRTQCAGGDNHLFFSPTIRVPDVIGLTLRDALLTTEEDIRLKASKTVDLLKVWKDHAFNAALENPEEATTFGKLQVGLELKRTDNPMELIPLEFSDELQEVPARKVIDSMDVSPEPSPEGRGDVTNSKKRKSDSSVNAACKRTKKSAEAEGDPPGARSHTFSNAVRDFERDSDVKLPARKHPPNVQVAIYAAERLSSSIAINHSLQFVIIDSTIWLWWFDRGGAIQSGGMNFIRNLPYLVVLLDILRRFDQHAWGVNRVFKKKETDGLFDVELLGPQPELAKVTVTLDARKIPLYLHLFSRGTAVVPATSKDPCPISPNTKLSKYDMVAKIYHVDEQQENEIKILTAVYEVASRTTEGAKHVRGHVPVLFAAGDWEDEYGERVERILNISRAQGKRLSRRLRVLLFQRLEPIHKLSGKKFMKAFRDCFCCHGVLWMNNIHHRDISENNLMFTRVKGGVVGVLNDFDLSIIHRDDRPLASERTGTIPFMSYDLLYAFKTDRRIPHIYEYDVESFVYVAMWISARYQDGEVINHDAYREWTKTTIAPHLLAGTKRNSLSKPVLPTKSHGQHFDIIMLLAAQVVQCLNNAQSREIYSNVALWRAGTVNDLPPYLVQESPKAYYDRLSLIVNGIHSDYVEYFEMVDKIVEKYKDMGGLSLWCSQPDA
ncbi:hypothetical protein NEOLEDRAFT_337984 [Neolentinus lepideus HHB14362 ss-1]|uniref:Fungal-type protein kinase domain-containing protein n=1 Tax=Neolentinus lepideus HHB14362 ss-1 TaxID=1314782 RepID=A0A165SVH7_9AGAM|nr:hypothetical protein NEOLEDRAFT_337984 [Neolentinus lepideus HHB14362 ss-1]